MFYTGKRKGVYRHFRYACTGFILVLSGLILSAEGLFYSKSFWLAFLGLVFLGAGALGTVYEIRQALGLAGVEYRSPAAFFAQNQNREFIAVLQKELLGHPFNDAVAALLASVCVHFAKIDGHISQKEIKVIQASIKGNFVGGTDQNLVARIANLTRARVLQVGEAGIMPSIISVMDYFQKLLRSHLGCMKGGEQDELFNMLLVVIYETILADGRNIQEEHAFRKVCSYFGVSVETQNRVRRTAGYQHQTRKRRGRKPTPGPVSKFKESLALFDLKPGYTRKTLDKAWKKTALSQHPDRFHGSPPEMYKSITERFLLLKETYQYLSNRLG